MSRDREAPFSHLRGGGRFGPGIADSAARGAHLIARLGRQHDGSAVGEYAA